MDDRLPATKGTTVTRNILQSEPSTRIIFLSANIEELGESESLFKAIFDNAGMGIGIADMAGRILDSNPAFQEMLGYSQGELREKRFIDITYPPDIDLNVELFNQTLTV